jgi:putative ABC transport system permease protein
MFSFLMQLVRRIRFLVHRHEIEADLEEEITTHLAMLADETNLASARQRLGNTTRWQEMSREAWGWNWLESLARDIRYGTRLLTKSPGFTVTACLSLAIGLGSTMGIFSLINALLLKTLPVAEPQQLWEMGHKTTEEKDDNFSYRMLDALQRANPSGIPLFAVGSDYLQVNYGSSIRNALTLIVSGETFRILGLKAQLGRLLNKYDDMRGVPHGANCVLSYRLWQSQYHADPGVLGKHISIGAQSFTIVGVAPANFFGLNVGAYSDLILPIAAYAATNPAQPILDNGGWTWLNILFRLPPGIAVQDFTSRLNTVYPTIRKEIEPSSAEAAKPDRLYAQPAATGLSAIRNRFSKPLYVLLTMTGLILTISCANLANLLLARSVVRSRELAIRLSIGAKRGRVLRQLLTESALIATFGAGISIPIYFACTGGLVAFLQSGSDPAVFLDTSPDWRFAAAAFALLAFTVVLFGFVPAWRAIRTDLNTTLSENSQRLTAKTSFGKALVGVQVGLSFVLLLGAMLLARSLFELRTFNPGFRRDHILIAGVDTTQAIQKNADVARFFDRLLEKVRALPGVRAASASVVVPLSGRSWQQDYEIPGNAKAAQVRHSFENWVTPEYFETLGTPLVLGRYFARADSAKAVHVALVNQAFATYVFGSSNPVGRQVYEHDKKDPITIVGIVGDARYRKLREAAPPTLYRPIAQLPPSFDFLLSLNLEVWTETPSAEVVRPVRELVSGLNDRVSVEFHTFDSMIDTNLLYERLLTVLSVAFALIGLVLSSIGVYGVSANSVARRTAEFGIRMAMGATPQRILASIFGEYLSVLAVGLTGGLFISIALMRFLQAWLFGVAATDPYLFSLALVLVSAFALTAIVAPASRAAHLNPMTALRCE